MKEYSVAIEMDVKLKGWALIEGSSKEDAETKTRKLVAETFQADFLTNMERKAKSLGVPFARDGGLQLEEVDEMSFLVEQTEQDLEEAINTMMNAAADAGIKGESAAQLKTKIAEVIQHLKAQ